MPDILIVARTKERRVCPDDGKTYTFDELKKAYAGDCHSAMCISVGTAVVILLAPLGMFSRTVSSKCRKRVV